ncbi:hypothetical protein HanXRQr2_Chr17g0829931 [Helianthus annuus]|uniref:Uncharacterized protein n=1 Tax=Helianthus annuus TaxID=4232 RepID=A0A251RUP3_HELAN|nr:hypothetical protein HanXRQr2_Chr17g0829931 [Helianthus annuus]KAJ0830390.1 hypothetical protein HanPSC8_Chr15g0654881 [Helianthus annuus]
MERFFYFNFMSRIMSDYKVEMINDGMQKSYVHFHRFNLWNVPGFCLKRRKKNSLIWFREFIWLVNQRASI